ncbi:MAG: hypothetical protein A2Y73_08135 [Chloroflexi bacterium RBG_13_56_8]|nr:MAG: hypothetical protein A2Y73_08135 [Chloroflexi bacterium RBG_13_56_8]
MGSQAAKEILGQITSEKLEKVILDLASTQPTSQERLVVLEEIVRALVKGKELGIGSERLEAYLEITRAIKETVGLIQGMRYVEANS